MAPLAFLFCVPLVLATPGPWHGSSVPTLNGDDYPEYTAVFKNGECDATDHGHIAQEKQCYGCFRIPSLAHNPVTGVLHAFVEARRGGLAHTEGSCPDLPDTRIAWKRSLDGGTTWSDLRILVEVPGLTRDQPTPVIDCVTGMLHLTFATWNSTAGSLSSGQYPMIMNSSDDGMTWSRPVDVPCPTCKGGTFGHGVVPGNSRGLCIRNATINSGYRLVSPTWSGSQYSDDGGHTWTLYNSPSGENSITPWWKGGYIMTSRAGKGKCAGATGRGADMCYRFSPDAIHWGPFLSPTALWPMVTGSADSSAAIGVPGGVVFIHGGGVVRPKSGMLGSGGSGVTLFFSPDGQAWKLMQHIWPLYGGYATVESTDVDASGAVTGYAALYEGGGLFDKREAIIFSKFNFTGPPSSPILV